MEKRTFEIELGSMVGMIDDRFLMVLLQSDMENWSDRRLKKELFSITVEAQHENLAFEPKITNADNITSQLIRLEEDARRVGNKAEQEKDFRSALMAIREQVRLIEFRERLLGKLDPIDRSYTTVNQIETVNVKALLLDPKSRGAIEILASRSKGLNNG